MFRFVYYAIPLVLSAHYIVTSKWCPEACIHLAPIVTPILLFLCLHAVRMMLIHTPLTITAENGPQCNRCGCTRLETTKHCNICNTCVEGFDHHCDVLEMCIGRDNVQWFRAFLGGSAILCSYGAYNHAAMLQCTARTPALWAQIGYTALFVVELSFAISFSLFAAFHIGLCIAGTTTYGLILKIRGWWRQGEVAKEM